MDVDRDTLVIAGHDAPDLPELAELPTVAEPTAPPAANPVHPLAVPYLSPRQVLVLGRPTLHRSVSALLASPYARIVVLTDDPSWTDVAGTAHAVGRRVAVTGHPSRAWLDTCRALSDSAYLVVDRTLREREPSTGMHVAAAVTGALVAGDSFVVGASNPVRDVAYTWRRTAGVRVTANRGVAGIDGTVSTALGVALAGGRRTIALLGDLTFAHDSGGLLYGPGEPVPAELTVVVANDDGGGIFGLLEQGGPQHREQFERVFGTPHGTDFGALCAAHGIPHVVARAPELGALLGTAGPAGGVRVIEVPTSRTGLRELHARLRARLDAELCPDPAVLTAGDR